MSKSFTTALFCLFALLPCIGLASGEFATRQPRYHLHAGDVITVDYRYTPEYNATISIQPDGFASLPFLGDMKLGGLTLAEAHDQLLAKASDRLNQPEVTVGLKDFEKPYFIVGGEVASPGRFEIRGRVTALRAIEMAGGFKASSKASQVLLIRPLPAGQRNRDREEAAVPASQRNRDREEAAIPASQQNRDREEASVSGLDAETKLIDLKKVTDRHDMKEDVELQPGDLLVVPKTRLAKIEPYVKLANFGMYLNPFGL